MKFKRPALTVEATVLSEHMRQQLHVSVSTYFVSYPNGSQKFLSEEELEAEGFLPIGGKVSNTSAKQPRKVRPTRLKDKPVEVEASPPAPAYENTHEA